MACIGLKPNKGNGMAWAPSESAERRTQLFVAFFWPQTRMPKFGHGRPLTKGGLGGRRQQSAFCFVPSFVFVLVFARPRGHNGPTRLLVAIGNGNGSALHVRQQWRSFEVGPSVVEFPEITPARKAPHQHNNTFNIQVRKSYSPATSLLSLSSSYHYHNSYHTPHTNCTLHPNGRLFP
jgi:hypothetical protein